MKKMNNLNIVKSQAGIKVKVNYKTVASRIKQDIIKVSGKVTVSVSHGLLIPKTIELDVNDDMTLIISARGQGFAVDVVDFNESTEEISKTIRNNKLNGLFITLGAIIIINLIAMIL